MVSNKNMNWIMKKPRWCTLDLNLEPCEHFATISLFEILI